jgi:ketosteroid isomerase-like protein
MRHRLWLLAASLALLLVVPAHSRDNTTGPDQEAVGTARQFLDRGAQLYNAKDAKGLADTYTADAEIAIVSKKPGELKTEFKHGHAEIEPYYRGLFENAGRIEAKNTIEYARLLDRDMVLVAGVFQPDIHDKLKVPFVQVRVKQGDRWLIMSMRIFLVERQG